LGLQSFDLPSPLRYPIGMPIPVIDLRAQHDGMRADLEAAVRRIVDASAFVGGAEVQSFEAEFAAYCETAHAVAVANGTDALALALRALGVGPGAAVAVPAFTFAATAEAVCHVGARPLFVDVDPRTFLVDPDALRRAVRAAPVPVRAIIPVHLYGHPAPMDEIGAVAAEIDAGIVEDAAQAHGARYHGRRVGALGHLAAFSFYPTKNLGALGDAGAVTAADARLAERVRILRDHGQSAKYVHAVVGYNSRLDGVQAAVLRLKLRRLDEWNSRRRALAALYTEALTGVPGVEVPVTMPQSEHVYHLFVLRCRARDALRAHLDAAGIGTSIHYPVPLHEQPAFAATALVPEPCPGAAEAARTVLALPLYPELAPAQAQAVAAAVRDWAGERAASEGSA